MCLKDNLSNSYCDERGVLDYYVSHPEVWIADHEPTEADLELSDADVAIRATADNFNEVLVIGHRALAKHQTVLIWADKNDPLACRTRKFAHETLIYGECDLL